MSAQELVIKQRTRLLDALCITGSTEPLEKVLDVLLAQGELTWEDYHSVLVPGRALYKNARQLLDLVYIKGSDACSLFLRALKQVWPDVQESGLSLPQCSSNVQVREDSQCTSAHTLLTRRISLVNVLQGCLDVTLEALLESGHFTAAECDEVQLPTHTPSQQARRLLNYVNSKGEAAAMVVLNSVQQRHQSGSQRNPENLTKEFVKYQRKLSSSLSAQSCFLSTYGGTGHVSLEDIYVKGQLELAHNCPDIKGPLGLEDIVGPVGSENQDADTVLISGEVGSGKSTLLQRLHLLWARGEALQDFLLLFPFSCRRLNTEQRELSVQELLFQHCCWPDREQDKIFQFVLDHPQSILFTFDGLDELKQSFSDEHRVCCPTQQAPVHILLFNLIQGTLLKGVRKVVTSRPEAVGPSLRKHLCKEVLLTGFSPSAIDSFVRKHHTDPTVAARILASLRANTALLGLCHSPVLCWIVSQCYKELLGYGEGSPQTITDVYLMILQHFLQHQRPVQTATALSWPEVHLKTVLHLGELAFEGMQTTCYIFSGAQLQTHGVTEKDICTGFLVQSKDMSSTHSKHYEFLHATMQCFFAALYMVLSSHMERSTISKLFETWDKKETDVKGTCFGVCLPSTSLQEKAPISDVPTTETPNLQITATFVSGLLSLRHRNLWLHCCPDATLERKVKQVERCLARGLQKHFKSIPQPVQGEKKSMHAMPGFVWLIKCIYEMQECRIAKDAMRKLEVDHLKLTYCNIGPVECTALAYVLQHLRNPAGLQLDNNSVGDVGVEQLLPCLHICNSLYLRNNNITDEGIRKLIAKGIQCGNFRKIALFNNKLTDACTQHFAHLLKKRPDFLSLRLGNNNITAEGARQLADGLKSNHSLQYLGLWGNNIGDEGARVLANSLENSKTLVWLSLVGNGVGSAGACALGNVIENSTSLEELWLSDNCINRAGVEHLIKALQHNTKVRSVWLKNNDLNVEEVEELTQREARLTF